MGSVTAELACGLRAADLRRAFPGPHWDDVASLALPHARTCTGIQAFRAIGVVPHNAGGDDELRRRRER